MCLSSSFPVCSFVCLFVCLFIYLFTEKCRLSLVRQFYVNLSVSTTLPPFTFFGKELFAEFLSVDAARYKNRTSTGLWHGVQESLMVISCEHLSI